MTVRDVEHWATLCRGLGNPNRLRILKILNKKKKASVTELSRELGITLKNTSRNVRILSNLGLVRFRGHDGKVYYSTDPQVDNDIKKVLRIVL